MGGKTVAVAVTVAGVVYPSRNAAAKELVRLTSCTTRSAEVMLWRSDNNGDVALERLRNARRRSVKRDVKPKAHQDKAVARVAKAKPVKQARQYDPERAAAMAKIARETGFSVGHLQRTAKQHGLDLHGLTEWAQAQAPSLKARRARSSEIRRLSRETGFSENHLATTAKQHGLDLHGLTEWAQARTHSRQVTVAGKTYPNRAAYLRVLNHRYRIPIPTLEYWAQTVPLEGLPAKALASSKARDPERYRPRIHGGEVAAYGWRWRSATAFSIYYFGYSGGSTSVSKVREQSKTELSWAKAALPRLLHLFDSREIGADCRWSPEREAEMPPRYLPLNSRDAREHDEDDMDRWYAGIIASHARQWALGEAARMNTEQRMQS